MESPCSPSSSASLNVPITFWNMLSPEDQAEYIDLRTQFHNSSTRERHGSSIQGDLQTIKAYIERRSELQEIRSIVCGICFAGSFICVNTSQLKCLLGRCKSSINNGFQILGYFSAKTKVRQCIVPVLPSLLRDSSLLRQWTIRCTENTIRIPPPQLAPSAPPRKPLPTPNINRGNGPLPTPMINNISTLTNSLQIKNPNSNSTPTQKLSPTTDGLSPPITPFFDPPPEYSTFENILPASAPRPVSMPNIYFDMNPSIDKIDNSNEDFQDSFDIPLIDRAENFEQDMADWTKFETVFP
ncbi:hypothetical protein TVAG_165590 [Trichomonas vaginalis G3]|uniref:Initiator binding domain-containing protein n=1 Tax=Trichomonas vaginalis (strain ATCC PRA-98 / G3) TaxID=412133 RepID=A2DUP0_TRIV3|nr:transcription-initiator DNA-binding domain ibd family [Trichomonas vaginalis G3]EAY15931.1 hypothetical protein TVAG_165590 [Trichomonas vaginalis G3]KAI5506608.1 transcription-initiator DNA-binding domain ibd family [Trichomonas vaginalis G3]|eukprot:XP_001328154.1 hypothetical protein [Trichomonas vaginalis G3]